MIETPAVHGLAVALGIGLLVGLERERRRNTRDPAWAGVRTFVLVALGGGLAALLGPVGLAVAGAFTALAALAAWAHVASRDAGMTTTFAMLVVFLCGALAQSEPVLAAVSGVVVAVVLATKSRLHRFVRNGLTEQELHDLLLLAAATIVLPMLPDRPVDPWAKASPKRGSAILASVHETVADLHKAGLVKTETMREFDKLCLEPIVQFCARDIAALRMREKVSQPVFAMYLNVSKSSVSQWETGHKNPDGAALKLLNIVQRKGLEVLA